MIGKNHLSGVSFGKRCHPAYRFQKTDERRKITIPHGSKGGEDFQCPVPHPTKTNIHTLAWRKLTFKLTVPLARNF